MDRKEQHRIRMQRYRQRGATGVVSVRVESPPDPEDFLEAAGYLEQHQADDPAAVRLALTLYLSDHLTAAVMHHAGQNADVALSVRCPTAAQSHRPVIGRSPVPCKPAGGPEAKDNADTRKSSELPAKT